MKVVSQRVRRAGIVGVSVLALVAGSGTALAQTAPDAGVASDEPVDEIVVSGIRASLEKSLSIKRDGQARQAREEETHAR